MFECGFGGACRFCALGPHVGKKPQAVTLVFGAGARTGGQEKQEGSIPQRACLWKVCGRGMQTFVQEQLFEHHVWDAKIAKQKYWRYGGLHGETCCSDSKLAMGRELNSSSKKACVTASARVWYLEPKWLRYMLPASMWLSLILIEDHSNSGPLLSTQARFRERWPTQKWFPPTQGHKVRKRENANA